MPNIQMLELVVRKASEDTNFRNSLMQDSKTAIEQELGRSIPLSNADIVVTDQSNTDSYNFACSFLPQWSRSRKKMVE